MFSFFRQSFRQWARSGTKPAGGQKQPTRRLQCEVLEDRVVPSLYGTNFLVNSTLSGVQKQAASATSSDGKSVVVWTDYSNSSNMGDIKAQRFDAYGNKVGGEILVAGGRSPQNAPKVAMDAYGNFAVTWVHVFSSTDTDIHAALFWSSGSRRGSEITVANTPHNESDPSIAMAANGEFVVSYTYQFSSTDNDVKAIQFKPAGTIDRTFDVAVSTRNESQSSVSMAPDGRFAIAYNKYNDIVVQRYSSTAAVVGYHTVAATTNQEAEPSVAMDKYGNVLLAWQVNVSGNWNILGRSISSTGAMGSVFTVQATSAQETLPAIAVNSSTGKFVVAYQSQTTGNPSVKITEMSASRTPILTSTVSSSLGSPFVSLGGSAHRYLVVSSSFGSKGGDPDGGIFARFGIL